MRNIFKNKKKYKNFFYISSLFLIGSGLILFSSKANAQFKPTAVNRILPGSSIQAYHYTLPNGLKVIIIPDDRNPVATIHFMLNAGSDREHKNSTGLAHFFEHMMFRKSKGQDEGQYDRSLSSFGGSGNAGTSNSFVTYYSTFPGPALEKMLKLESERFLNLDLVDPYFSTEKGAVTSERKLRVENDPLQRSNEFIRSFTERDTPLEWITIGSKKDVENMKISDAKDFYDKYYTPDNTLLVIGGPFDPHKVIVTVNKYFGRWNKKLNAEKATYPKDYLTRDLGKKFICSAPVLNKSVTINFPSTDNSLKSIAYSTVFEAMLDDNPEGTFERRLIKNKIATSYNFINVFWENYSNPFRVNFTLTKEQDPQRAVQFWQKNIQDVLKKTISNHIRRQILKQIAVQNADAADRMTSLVNITMENVFFYKDNDAINKIEKYIKSVTTEEIRAWILEKLGEKKFYTTGIVTPNEAPSCDTFFAKLKSEKK